MLRHPRRLFLAIVLQLCINVSNVPLGNIACVAARAEASGLTRRHLTTSDGVDAFLHVMDAI